MLALPAAARQSRRVIGHDTVYKEFHLTQERLCMKVAQLERTLAEYIVSMADVPGIYLGRSTMGQRDFRF